jgi:hypothetical protein
VGRLLPVPGGQTNDPFRRVAVVGSSDLKGRNPPIVVLHRRGLTVAVRPRLVNLKPGIAEAEGWAVSRTEKINPLFGPSAENRVPRENKWHPGTRSMKIRTALGPLALVWASAAGLSLPPAAAQTLKSSQHDQAPVTPASLLARLQKDLRAELEGQEDECLPLEDHIDISRFDLGPTRETWHVEGRFPCLGGNDIWDQLLYVGTDQGWRRILNAPGSSLHVCPGADPPCPFPIRPQHRFTAVHGWPDLGLTMKPPTSIVRLQFDGRVYKAAGGCEVRYDGVSLVLSHSSNAGLINCCSNF